MEIYAVLAGWEYSTKEFIGCFSTLSEAKEIANKKLQDYGFSEIYLSKVGTTEYTKVETIYSSVA